MKKKQNIIETATRLFASQGFDGTTTLQIAREAGVTEPLIYYHFEGKNDLFTHIIEKGFNFYFERLNSLDTESDTNFEKIENLVTLHFRFLREIPDEIYLAFSTCPAKLQDKSHVCTKKLKTQRQWLEDYLTDCVRKGVDSGEFYEMPVKETVSLLYALIVGIIRQRGLHLNTLKGMSETTVTFCRRSLVK
ncbi:MAG: TetR/AcrR family transcriptional regulator [Deltaproteobacteria bacterium]|nr:TetR/AcrR family transcriptional regulator [Deltaproteobacteria bacterium]